VLVDAKHQVVLAAQAFGEAQEHRLLTLQAIPMLLALTTLAACWYPLQHEGG
jgi:hypothetical protein